MESRAKALIRRFIQRMRRPVTKTPAATARKRQFEWSIGIYTGESPLHLTSPKGIDNPVLTSHDISDVAARFIADPFMVKVDQTWYMFFEVLNHQAGKGEIGLATSEDGLQWKYQQIVLVEPFHLSYPYIFEWQGEYYMIPESNRANSIRLYRATNFPLQWSFVASLIECKEYADPSIFRFNDKWWLFTGHGSSPYHADVLRLSYATDLKGPWYEHPKSPVIKKNIHLARPAGRVLVLDEKIIRYAQDCYPAYGTQVHACEIIKLTTKRYRERQIFKSPVLSGGIGWNKSGMHHIDPHLVENGQWIACVDGWTWIELEDKKSSTTVL